VVKARRKVRAGHGKASPLLADKQWRLVPWSDLRAGGGNAGGVGEDLLAVLDEEHAKQILE
jgi:hypothetical protein